MKVEKMIAGAGRAPAIASPSMNSPSVSHPRASTALSWRNGITV